MVSDEEKWTENQRCPECRQDPGNCDWCSQCKIELQCAQTDEGLTEATLANENGEKVLYLARV